MANGRVSNLRCKAQSTYSMPGWSPEERDTIRSGCVNRAKVEIAVGESWVPVCRVHARQLAGRSATVPTRVLA